MEKQYKSSISKNHKNHPFFLFIYCVPLKGYVASEGIFSSPEYEVLMLSNCGRPSSTFYLVYALDATFSVRYS